MGCTVFSRQRTFANLVKFLNLEFNHTLDGASLVAETEACPQTLQPTVGTSINSQSSLDIYFGGLEEAITSAGYEGFAPDEVNFAQLQDIVMTKRELEVMVDSERHLSCRGFLIYLAVEAEVGRGRKVLVHLE